jgi:hypothetical protein
MDEVTLKEGIVKVEYKKPNESSGGLGAMIYKVTLDDDGKTSFEISYWQADNLIKVLARAVETSLIS